jgi:hypothetical protein
MVPVARCVSGRKQGARVSVNAWRARCLAPGFGGLSFPARGMGGRVVEGSGLENRRACKRTVGSNPTPSASESSQCLKIIGYNGSFWTVAYKTAYTSSRDRPTHGGTVPLRSPRVTTPVLNRATLLSGALLWFDRRAIFRPRVTIFARSRTPSREPVTPLTQTGAMARPGTPRYQPLNPRRHRPAATAHPRSRPRHLMSGTRRYILETRRDVLGDIIRRTRLLPRS